MQSCRRGASQKGVVGGGSSMESSMLPAHGFELYRMHPSQPLPVARNNEEGGGSWNVSSGGRTCTSSFPGSQPQVLINGRTVASSLSSSCRARIEAKVSN
jgi:hypothetical protein